MKTKLKVLQEITIELNRFNKKIALATKEQTESSYSVKHYAAAKRAAMDMKNELTKLTQDSKYRYSD